MKRVVLATVILSAVALTAAAQPVRLSGRVVSDETGDPLPNARVTLAAAPLGAPVVLTDRDGRFVLSSPNAPITVTASKTGYGRREVTAAAQPIEIRLLRGVAISGRVVDVRGDPIVGARVVAETATKTATGFAVAAATDTDDRGEYRMASLPADTFKVAVMTRGEPTRQQMPGGGVAMIPSMRKTYYPDADTPDAAEALRLEPGQDRPSLDFVLPAGVSMLQQMAMTAPFGYATPPAPAVRPTGTLRGRVVTTDGRAVPRAEVRLMQGALPVRAPGATAPPRPMQPAVVTADDDGRFEFAELAAGSFRIAAAKPGYSSPGEPLSFGPPLPMSGLAVDLAAGEIRERADVTLARWGTLTGRVFDELGEPVQGAGVQLLQVRYQGGRRRLVGAGGATRLTDDLGRYRIYGVAPGKYIVSAAAGDVGGADLPGYTRSYFPGGASAANAQFVSIDVGQQITDIDFGLERARTANVSGRLLDAAGEPTMGGSVRLVPSHASNAVTNLPANARLDRDGHFEFPNVTPGQYVIQVDRGRRNTSTEGEFGSLPVSVDGVDVAGLVVQMSAGSSIRGRVTFDAFQGTKEPRPGQIEITPVPIDADQSTASPANADIHEDWTFEMTGINGPRRLQLQQGPKEWTLKAIKVRGIDVTDRPLPFGRRDQSLNDVEVVLTDRLSGVGGTIVDDRARPAAGAHVVVFPIDRARWFPASRYVRTAVASDDGAITVAGLPPGSYYAAAVAQLPPDGNDAWQDPAYLESLVQRAAPFAIGEGQKQVLNLKLPDR